jgi:hypothetical protein
MGLPLDGLKMLFGAIISSPASICTSTEEACRAIWSPSKSALYAITDQRVNAVTSPSINYPVRCLNGQGEGSARD